MKKIISLKNTVSGLIILFETILFSLPLKVARADLWQDVQNKLQPVSTVYGTPGQPQDPRTVVMRTISYALGFLGVIFILLIIYAGFLWMTAAGNEEKVEKAKKIISRAAIGLAIVLIALAVTYFVFGVILSGTGAV